MKPYYAYIRVSTTRQGEEGVSLQEQRRAILEYACRNGITITNWFEEQVSAATRGRPVFTKLVNMLKKKTAAGLIIHKIDRGARNLRDWADIAELMDRGVQVHFVHESIDLHSRSGRLSADILAVVAADYIRNLREETLKGINGRLRQGIFPFAAPVGYINTGRGKPKTIDPVRGPLIKLAFELYATRMYTLRRLETTMYDRGLRTKTGKRVPMNQFAQIFRNPFYMGLMRLRNRKDTYPGIHEPLISSSLYNQVQLVLDGKRSRLRQRNHFLFRLLITCEYCRLNLAGERQRGHIYYRCHRRMCPVTCIREERFEAAMLEVLKQAAIEPHEEPLLAEALSKLKNREIEIAKELRHDTAEELERIRQSMNALLQKFLDQSISKELFDENHTSLLMQRRACEETLEQLTTEPNLFQHTVNFLTRLRASCQTFCTGTPEERRQIVEFIATKITADADAIHIVLTPLIEQVIHREKTKAGWEIMLSSIAKIAPQI
jgi:site-specific DNA recombinase